MLSWLQKYGVVSALKLAPPGANRQPIDCNTSQSFLLSGVRVRRPYRPRSTEIHSHVPRTKSAAEIIVTTTGTQYPIPGTILCRQKDECPASFDARLEPA